MKQWLRDDVETPDWASRSIPRRVMAALDDDSCCPLAETATTVETPLMPTVMVRVRRRIGFDGNGAPMFDWATLVEAPAVLFESRTEVDDEAGQTYVEGRVTVVYDGDEEVRETAGVWIGEERWRVTSVRQVAGVLEMVVNRIDG